MGPHQTVTLGPNQAVTAIPAFAVYSGTQAYVTHMSRRLRAELGPKNVRVAAIEPGIVGTELQSHVTDEGARAWMDGSKETMEWLTPEDHAHRPNQLRVAGGAGLGQARGAGPGVGEWLRTGDCAAS